MRLFALLLTCAPVAAAGGVLMARRRRRERALKGFAALFGGLAHAPIGFGGEICPILRLAAPTEPGRFTFAAAFARIYGAAGEPAAAWRRASRESAEGAALLPEERELLAGFAEAFAEASLQGFRAVCEGYALKFASLAETAAARNDKNEKACVTFSALLAALLFIILV